MANTQDKSPSKKPKLVRDSFTIPKTEFAAIDAMKTRAIGLGASVKKSELLRAGLMLLQSLNDNAFMKAVAAVPTLKTGRPSTEAVVEPSVKTAPAKTVRTTSPKKTATAKNASVAPARAAKRTTPAPTPQAPKPASAKAQSAPKA